MIDFATILVNLFLVSIVLFVYRQYDKRSRALDKIKKFIDLTKVNLEDFIEDKTKEINDLAVDMEAYQRSSIEIIKKIEEVQQKIKNKSNDFAEVEKKIAYHDSMLKDLDEMTFKVQENIERLQVDGKIVDKLSKTLKGFNTQIDSVESNLNSVLEKFDKTNKENLESIKIASWEKFDTNIKDLVFKMDNLNKEIDLYEKDLANIEERKKDILVKGEFNIVKYNKEIENSFGFYEDKYKLIENSIELIMESVKNKINEKEDFILNRLNEELQNKFKDIFTYVDDRSKEIQDKLEDKLILVDDEISSMSSSFKDNVYSRINSLEESIRIEMGKYEEQVDDVFDKFRSQVELNLKNIYEDYEDKINQVDKNIKERVERSSRCYRSYEEA